MNIYEVLKQDKNNIWYIDNNDKLDELFLVDINKPYKERKKFYKIDGIDNYIIRDCTDYPHFLNGSKNYKLIKKLVAKQEELPDIGFPIGYYKKNDVIKGTIIPYYKDAISLRKICYLYKNELNTFYNHSDNGEENFICLLLDILELLNRMYNKEVMYVDIHYGNFLIWNNDVKVIDFEPGYVYFSDKLKWHYESILRNYSLLVGELCRRFGYKNILFPRQESFMETEYMVKSLRKRLER